MRQRIVLLGTILVLVLAVAVPVAASGWVLDYLETGSVACLAPYSSVSKLQSQPGRHTLVISCGMDSKTRPEPLSLSAGETGVVECYAGLVEVRQARDWGHVTVYVTCGVPPSPTPTAPVLVTPTPSSGTIYFPVAPVASR